MNKIKKYSIIFIIYIIIIGCPYESPIAISPKSEPIIESLIGRWNLSNNNNYIYVKATDGVQYHVTTYEYTDTEISNNYYYAHTSTIDNKKFLNVKPIHSEKNNYFLYKIEYQSNDSLLIIEMSDRIKENFLNSDDLISFIEKYKDLSFFWGDEYLYLKENK